MTRLQAMTEIIREARRERSSLAAYKRVMRALRELGFTVEEQDVVLAHLDYVKPGSSIRYEWLAQKLAAEAK